MSIEGPEAHILAGQLRHEVVGRQVVGCDTRVVARLQRSGFVNADLHDFDRLIGGRVVSVRSRGATIHVRLDNGSNLIIGPEYGGRVLLHAGPPPAPVHLVLSLDDGRSVSVRLTGMGSLRCEDDGDLDGNYVYRRDFSTTPDPITDPIDEAAFDLRRMLKAMLVGKEAAVVGIANSAFQEIAFRAGLHPKRKGSSLTSDERRRLVDALPAVIEDRLNAGGKSNFVDLYRTPGRHEPVMGPNRKGGSCPACGAHVETVTVGGGRTYFCPRCQT